MIKEAVLRDFSSWDSEKQLKEYQGYKALGDYSPFSDEDYALMEMIMNNPNVEIDVQCNDGVCEIVKQDEIVETIIQPSEEEIVEQDEDDETLNESEEKRYVVTLEMYMWARDDKAVIVQAEKLAKKLDAKDDNQCEVTGIVEQPHGTLGNRKVK